LGIPLWAIVANYFYSISIFCMWPILHLRNAKPGNNTGIIGNFERIIGSFWGNKRIELQVMFQA